MIRLNTNIFRPRLTMWSSSLFAIIFLTIGIKTWQDFSLVVTILCFSFGILLGLLSVLSIKTYKEKFLRIDINRWKNRGVWKDKGIKSKLEVIGDWISN